MSAWPFNELDLLLDYLRDMLELRNPEVPQKLALEHGILPVVDVLAARDDVRIIGDTFSLNGVIAQQHLLKIGPAVSNAQYVTLAGEWACVLAVSAQMIGAGANFKCSWSLEHQNTAPAINIPLRGLSVAPGELYTGDGANLATLVTYSAANLQPAPTRLTQPWVIPPDYCLAFDHLGLAAGQVALVQFVAAIFPRGSKPLW